MLGIALLGTARTDADPHQHPNGEEDGGPQSFSAVSQSMPRWTLDIDDFVYALSDNGFRQFHTHDGTLNLEYYERLIATADQFGPEVALAIVDRLRRLTDADAVLDVVEKKVRWQSSESRGGASMTSDDRGLQESAGDARCPGAHRDADRDGRVPGNDPSEFEFIAPGDQRLRTGEFVAYNATVDGERKRSSLG